ncbi:transportin-3 [Anthonomus grandis grandis]|uniref:transportin-3 n=1 Tax=Anthonomus grandis grandis TaxID=2921223 RepID=UPI002166AC7E|nr:transportin-3 [Anthonomus grandis grandis]
MEEKPNLDVVILAVSTLYKNPDRKEKERASEWLLNLQKSVHAWSIADEVLHKKPDLESCYFAAQTMRTKIHQSFYELPQNVHAALRDSLLEHISQINEGTNTVITTQLCLALSDLILQMPTWQRAPLDIINRFSNMSYVGPLIEVLTVLPEELESKSVRLGENRRYEVLEELKQCAPTVVEFLKHCCTMYGQHVNENTHILARTLRCFTSWISVGAIPLHGLTDNVVLNLAFQILDLQSHEGKQCTGALCDAATECICTLLQCLEDNNNQQDLENYLFSNILKLEISYHVSVSNEDQSKSIDYCRLFTELGESFLEKIVSSSTPGNTHYAIKVLDLVLMCVGHHDYEVAEITFNLWYLLSEELYQKNNKELTELFRPYIERLITALCRHCQMEPDCDGLLDDGDEFKDFRQKVLDLIKDVVFIVGSSSCFRQMFLNLQAQGVTWDQTEAALFVMQAVAKNVLPTENEVVPKVVEAILNLPESTHLAVRHTSVLLLGELCEWIEEHPHVLDPTLNFLVQGLAVPGLSAAAATALQNICVTCNTCMPRYMPILLQVMHQVDNLSITNNAVIGILKGVAAIVSVMSHQEITVVLRELCFMQLTPLIQLIKQDVVPIKGTTTDPVLWLDRLSAILRHVSIHSVAEGQVHPCKPVVLDVWPVLSQAFDKYQKDIRIMERCCRSIRFMLRCASQQVCEILESLVRQIIAIYGEHKHSCLLYVGSILVDEYATDPQCVAGLLDMLQVLIGPTFQMLQEEVGLRNHPDTVDDFFRLCARFIQRASVPFLRSSALVPIVQCGLLAASLDHKEANMSVMKFFHDLVNQGQSSHSAPDFAERRKLVQETLDQFGQQLITALLQAAAFYLHTYMLSEVGDVFVQLLDFDRETTSKWVAHGLDTLPKQTDGGLIIATPNQLNDIHLNLIRSNSSKSVTHVLKELSRLYR